MKKILFIGDPLETLHFETDSSLALAQSFIKKGAAVEWADSQDLHWSGTSLKVLSQKLQFPNSDSKPQVSDKTFQSLEAYSLVWIRKDPPFDESYVRLCWLLAPWEAKVRMMAKPSQLLRYHEKMLPYEAFHQGFLFESDIIPMSIGATAQGLADFLDQEKGSEFIAKPWLGYQGRGVREIDRKKASALGEVQRDEILEAFFPEVRERGDRRVFFWQGQYLGDFARIPAKGRIEANLAQGGHAEIREHSKEEKKLIWKIEKFLQKVQIDFAGADFISNRLNEINITSPTGLISFEALTGQNLADKIVSQILEGHYFP